MDLMRDQIEHVMIWDLTKDMETDLIRDHLMDLIMDHLMDYLMDRLMDCLMINMEMVTTIEYIYQKIKLL